jgi:triacylglycerol lipase
MPVPLRTLRVALVLPMLLAVLAVPAAPVAAAPSGPPLSVAERELSAALGCPRSLAGVTRAPVLLVPGSFLEPRANFDWNYERALDAAGIPWCAVTAPRYAAGDIQDTAEYVVYALRRMHEESAAGRAP